MIRRPPRSTRTDTLFPYTTLFRSRRCCLYRGVRGARSAVPDPAQECRALYFARRPPDRLRAAAEAARCRDDLGRPRTHPILPRSICDRPRRVRHRRAAERLSQGRALVLRLGAPDLSFGYPGLEPRQSARAATTLLADRRRGQERDPDEQG